MSFMMIATISGVFLLASIAVGAYGTIKYNK